MAKMFSTATVHESVPKGTSQGKKPITSTMNTVSYTHLTLPTICSV